MNGWRYIAAEWNPTKGREFQGQLIAQRKDKQWFYLNIASPSIVERHRVEERATEVLGGFTLCKCKVNSTCGYHILCPPGVIGL